MEHKDLSSTYDVLEMFDQAYEITDVVHSEFFIAVADSSSHDGTEWAGGLTEETVGLYCHLTPAQWRLSMDETVIKLKAENQDLIDDEIQAVITCTSFHYG